MHIKKTDLAWVAGLLEGEGCFTLKSRPNISCGTARGNILVECHMCDRDVLERLHNIVNCGNVNGPYKNGTNPKHRPRHMFRVSGTKAYKLMKLILPFMCSRRSTRIRQLIQMYEQVKPKIYHIKNLRSSKIHKTIDISKWCSDHDLSYTGLYRTMNGERIQCRGWQWIRTVSN